MGHRFLSPEWVDCGRRLVAESPEFRKTLGGISTTVLTVVTETPTGNPHYLWHEVQDGELVRLESGDNGSFANRQAALTIRGTYATFSRLQRGQLTPRAAYLQRLIKLDGDVPEAMRFAPAFIKYHELVRKVETDF